MIRLSAIVLVALCAILVCRGGDQGMLQVRIDDKKESYQVCFEDIGELAEYDSLDLASPAPGIAPRAMRILVRTKDGAMVTSKDGYSSYSHWSGSPLDEAAYRRLRPGQENCSDWLAIGDLVTFLERDSHVSASTWGEVRLLVVLRVRTRGGEVKYLKAESPWTEISDARLLREQGKR